MSTDTPTRYIDVPLTDDQRLSIGMIDVASSQIAALGYDEPSQTLVVQFTTNPRKDQVEGDVYRYANVDRELYAEFAAAESKGRFFKDWIRSAADKYPFAVVRRGAKAQITEQPAAA